MPSCHGGVNWQVRQTISVNAHFALLLVKTFGYAPRKYDSSCMWKTETQTLSVITAVTDECSQSEVEEPKIVRPATFWRVLAGLLQIR